MKKQKYNFFYTDPPGSFWYLTVCPRKKWAPTNVVPSYKFCFENGSYIQIIFNATIITYHCQKRVFIWWDSFCSYDFKCALQSDTNFTTFYDCFVCGQSTTQQKQKQNKEMVLRVSLHSKSFKKNHSCFFVNDR